MLHNWATVKDIREYLLHYLRLYGTSKDNYWIDVNPIGFKSGKDKLAWRTSWDTTDFRTFADFLEDPIWGQDKMETPLHFGFFCTSPKWVGAGNRWKEDPWHCWAVATISQGRGKGVHCLIWDCNAKDNYPLGTTIRKRMLGFKQWSFVNFLSKRSKVWIGGGGNEGQGICVQATASFLVNVMKMGPNGFPTDSKTWEELGYRRVWP